MSRVLTVGAAQMGPIQLADARPEVVERLVALLRSGAVAGCDLVVFPELAVAEVDLDLCAGYTGTLFDFHRYRRPEVYGRITAQRGPEVPAGVRAALDDNVESSAESKGEGP